MSENTLKLIKEYDVKWVDLRFTDPKGKEQHTTVPAGKLEEPYIVRPTSLPALAAHHEVVLTAVLPPRSLYCAVVQNRTR